MVRNIGPAALAALLGEGWRRPGAAAVALADSLRGLVVDGRLPVQTRIPSERALAPELGVGRGTVSRAYDRLREEGFLISDRGAGSRLVLPPGRPGASVGPPVPGSVAPQALDLTIAALPGPEPLLAEVMDPAVRAFRALVASHGYAAAGIPALREALAERFTARGAPTTADQVLVTAGAQHALHLVLTLLCAPGDRALLDAPTYPRTLAALRTARVRAVGVPLGPQGWDVDAWRASLTVVAPRVALTIPDFHNPTGLTMAASDRAALAEACARAGSTLVVDETMTELRLDGPAVPAPVCAFDPGAAVITVGSMSKAAWGGLRLGWIRASPALVRDLAAVRADLDMASPAFEQALSVELLARWDEVLANRRALLRPRRDALLAALDRHAPGWSLRVPHGGLSAWIRLPGAGATALAAEAARDGVLITPGPAFSVDGTFEHHLRLPFTAAPQVLEEGVRRLAAYAHDLGELAGPGRAPAPHPSGSGAI